MESGPRFAKEIEGALPGYKLSSEYGAIIFTRPTDFYI